jgi:hypothetical protein
MTGSRRDEVTIHDSCPIAILTSRNAFVKFQIALAEFKRASPLYIL